ncbi:DUF2071 domain-containing protein [Gemmatimonas sp.]|uniref:DUF2071 domain-containing protein n=1 Tax=Gemmatimonas sp. TaxID=1962908 RepID=UPI00286DB86C|nr:DUF2071 domain-containing protein [Gemmatimonas sp.]
MSIAARLRRHPFPVAAHFDRVVALSFAFPAHVVQPLVPRSLSLDVFNGYAFVAVAMVWTRALRPAWLPAIFGQDFFLAGYRVFTRFQEPSGRRLRGLRILRSTTDKHRMVRAGNLMTGYRYSHVNVSVQERDALLNVTTTDASGATALDVRLDLSPHVAERDVPMPVGSPFASWTEARRFAGPMPFTFSPEGDDTMVVVEGSRQHWTPRPIAVTSWQVSMFNESPLSAATPLLANAFVVDHVDYAWKRGRVVHATPAAE